VVVTVVLGTAVTLGLGLSPAPAVNMMRSVALPMLMEGSHIGREGMNRLDLSGSTVAPPIEPARLPAPGGMGRFGPPSKTGIPPRSGPGPRLMPPDAKAKGEPRPKSQPQPQAK
jgi:hypothetical protein